jgi:hypothetical protein
MFDLRRLFCESAATQPDKHVEWNAAALHVCSTLVIAQPALLGKWREHDGLFKLLNALTRTLPEAQHFLHSLPAGTT